MKISTSGILTNRETGDVLHIKNYEVEREDEVVWARVDGEYDGTRSFLLKYWDFTPDKLSSREQFDALDDLTPFRFDEMGEYEVYIKVSDSHVLYRNDYGGLEIFKFDHVSHGRDIHVVVGES